MTDSDGAADLPADHAERRSVADEVHARPHQPLVAPLRATYVAVMIAPDDRPRERAHLAALCAAYGVTPPAPDASHFTTALGELRLTWERHTEFSAYTFRLPGLSVDAPFGDPPLRRLPDGWSAGIPGRTIVAVHAKLLPDDGSPVDAASVARWLGGGVPVGALVGDGAGAAFTDFRLRDDGHVRVVVRDISLTPRQAGRTLQRLFEIEAYRVMALLALPIARRLAPHLHEIEAALGALTDAIARESGGDEALLVDLSKLAARVESGRNASQMRFGASRAYYDLVKTRIGELRERRLPGVQTIEEFMTRRLAPAMATCASTAERLQDLSVRVAHASALLSTRVEIARERQNFALLASMERRARLQLRLQQTVEWLSVAAVTYYGAGVVAYAAKALRVAGLDVNPDVAAGVAVPLIAGIVIAALAFARRASGRARPAG